MRRLLHPWHVDLTDRWDPSNPLNKDRLRDAQRAVRRMLRQWDAIGVGDAPEAADEYDCMVPPLIRQLHSGATPREIVEWIDHERTDHFGLGADPAADWDLAQALRRWSDARDRQA